MTHSFSVKMLHLILILLMTLISTSSGHRCYVCNKCSEPFKLQGTEVQAGCSFCSTIRTYVQDRLQVTSRSCVPVCVEADARRSGSGIVTSCCQDDLCNATGRIQIPLTLIMSSVFFILPMLSTYF
ncbi:hypothetical protein EWB00_004264 [Schistosoma japonicum]|uniref:SJCHGC01866 protein n=1 Tax=Schistosoma japonicum TaxID=6182 RepID=Q5DC93_SCHJA|nr:SJCHGC01866 protein [Schistosoma japonicum]KAH8851957.1 hypothetical protein KSF78_0000996 [Schistosoma japonicum]TNN11745.1 hypothetical protein EWB00_004264 [Schistosoma japonicum]